MIEFNVALQPADPFSDMNAVDAKTPVFRRGEIVTLVISGTLKPGFHTYPMTERSSDPDQPESGLSQLRFAKELNGLQPLWPIQESPPPQFVKDKRPPYSVLLEYEHSFQWSQELLVLPDAKPGDHTLSFTIKLQVCDENQCVPGVHHFEVPFTTANTAPLPLSAEIQKRRQAKQPPILVRQVAKELANGRRQPAGG
ncbi:MAG: hypothetical protein ACRELG_05255, partial [Gemmataceae bacterium]